MSNPHDYQLIDLFRKIGDKVVSQMSGETRQAQLKELVTEHLEYVAHDKVVIRDLTHLINNQ